MSSPHNRLEELQSSIAARLRSVCYDWPRDRFEYLVQRIAFIEMKYERMLLPYELPPRMGQPE